MHKIVTETPHNRFIVLRSVSAHRMASLSISIETFNSSHLSVIIISFSNCSVKNVSKEKSFSESIYLLFANVVLVSYDEILSFDFDLKLTLIQFSFPF